MQHTRMSRGKRVTRGAWFASFATLLAASSHVLAGGNTPAVAALLATAIAVLPLCVALAGRELSLWRVSLAVGLSQALFHWSFGAIGVVGNAAGASTPPLPAHAEHLGLVTKFVPSLESSLQSSSAGAGWLMFIGHAFAAAATIAMLRFGELALCRIREALASVRAGLLGRVPATPLLLPSAGPISSFGYVPRRPLAGARTLISYRGPPARMPLSA